MESYKYHLYSVRPSYGVFPAFIHGDKAPSAGFISLYAVDEATASAIKQEGTAKGFKGIVWNARLWIDFDNEEAAGRARGRLKEMGYDHVVYDTGNRGIHVGILRNIAPSHLLPARDKAWVKEHFPNADLGIYTHLHPFRLLGTIHEKTGKRKQLEYHHEGSTLTLPPYKDEDIQNSQSSYTQTGNRTGSIFDSFRIMVHTAPLPPASERHPALVRLLYALYNEGIEPDKALWWTLEWNKMLAEPKEPCEVEKAFKSIYK